MIIGLPLSKHESQWASSLTLLRASQALEQPRCQVRQVFIPPLHLPFPWEFLATSLPGNSHLTASCHPGESEGDWETPKSYTEKHHILLHFISPLPNPGESLKRP